MALIDTAWGLRGMIERAKNVRSDAGVSLLNTSTLTATNVQDAINQIAILAGGAGLMRSVVHEDSDQQRTRIEDTGGVVDH